MANQGAGRNAVGGGLGEQARQFSVKRVIRVASGHVFGRFGARNNTYAAAAAQIEPAFSGKDAIGAGDGIVVDVQIHGQLANCRESRAGSKVPGNEQSANLGGDLFVGGRLRGEVDLDNRRGSHCLLYVDNIHSGEDGVNKHAFVLTPTCAFQDRRDKRNCSTK